MVKPLTFKGDKKTRKRKRADKDDEPRKQLATSSAAELASVEDADDQTWVSADVTSDIAGPVLIVLPTSPPTCLACDANGKVFASELENLMEGDPSTAEPHDVRQVWIATRVAGTEGFNFKGHHGRYLSCDKYGMLSANAPAISVLESFVVVSSADSRGLFSFQICGGDKEAFLSVKEGNKGGVEIRGDADNVSFSTSFRIRMQARFKPKIKASKESKALERISRKELESLVGRKLEDHEVKRLRKARKEGNFYEEVLDVRVKGKHDKFAY
ncbi:hypothetical protein VTO42DRAFT_905 [Malbranchea cinnamomea]